MPTPVADQRRLLGAFLRTHRERLSPLAAGLAAGPRRRTPGLRREEAAQLAGVSATWYTWLEQGRDVSASPEALGRVAGSLQLTRAERAYLFELAGRRDPAAPAAAAEAPPGLAEAAARFEGPAYGLDRCWTAVCWNAAAGRLFAGWLDGAEPNLLRYLFLDPGARRLVVDWPDRARRVIAEFRADFSRSLSDPQMRRLVDGLRGEDATFAAMWDEQSVLAREGGLRRFDHPQDGPLAFEQFTFQPADRPDCKLVLLAPRD
ncbi:helix-turn-helix transcriptional regulator [Phenylobacterium sp. LjRoot225]|uniref:helix-turn-helix transcriptional regulator n=1 Tax=Phenylobacterium sp. LjRoot225 TaxID=3342285 RepID=UPI003ECEED55